MPHLMLLTEIGKIVGAAKTLQGVLDRVVALVAERMHTDVCAIWLLDGARTRLTMAAARGLAPEAIGKASLERGQGITWQVLARMAPVLVEDAPIDPNFFTLPVIHEEPYHSYLGLPLRVRSLPIGVIYVQTSEPRRFDEDEVRALSAIASQIAPVVDNARLLALVAKDETSAPPPRQVGPRHYFGTPCSSGIVTGSVLRLGGTPEPDARPPGPLAEEQENLEHACEQARAELLRMQEWLRERNAEEAALVFSIQLMMLEDQAFVGSMSEAVEGGLSAAGAIERVTANFVARFASLKDLFFRERVEDVEDLAGRLLRHVRAHTGGPREQLRDRIAVLPLLAPSRMVSLCAEGVAAVLAGGGGATSHAALLARSLDLPLIVGLGDFIHDVEDGQRVLVDAATGEVVVDPPRALVDAATRTATTSVEALRDAFDTEGGGTGRLRFEANVSLWGDAVRARAEGADGIGLYRTEFAFLMRPDLPGEDEQYVLYRRVVEQIAPRPVTFRLLDAGGDKLVPALGQAPEPNPFLGYRSLRLLLDHPEILHAQARAIVKALAGTAGRLLVPMVGSCDEFETVRRQLDGEDLPPLGAMIELPSVLFDIEALAASADFLSIGTNDLTQHLLGVDRTNARVTRYFDPCHPAVIRALHTVARAAHAHQTPLGVCGEAASNPILLPLWLGLGVERLSVHASRVRILRTLEGVVDHDAADAAIPELLKLGSATAVRERLTALAPPEVRQWASVRKTTA